MIHLGLTNHKGEMILDVDFENYDEFVRAVKNYKPLIVSVDNGEEGVSVCPNCGAEYLYGEDARADAGLKCDKCAFEGGEQ